MDILKKHYFKAASADETKLWLLCINKFTKNLSDDLTLKEKIDSSGSIAAAGDILSPSEVVDIEWKSSN